VKRIHIEHLRANPKEVVEVVEREGCIAVVDDKGDVRAYLSAPKVEPEEEQGPRGYARERASQAMSAYPADLFAAELREMTDSALVSLYWFGDRLERHEVEMLEAELLRRGVDPDGVEAPVPEPPMRAHVTLSNEGAQIVYDALTSKTCAPSPGLVALVREHRASEKDDESP